MATKKNQTEHLEQKTAAPKEKDKSYKKKVKKLSGAKSLPTSRDSSGKKDSEDTYFYPSSYPFGLRIHRWSWF